MHNTMLQSPVTNNCAPPSPGARRTQHLAQILNIYINNWCCLYNKELYASSSIYLLSLSLRLTAANLSDTGLMVCDSRWELMDTKLQKRQARRDHCLLYHPRYQEQRHEPSTGFFLPLPLSLSLKEPTWHGPCRLKR